MEADEPSYSFGGYQEVVTAEERAVRAEGLLKVSLHRDGRVLEVVRSDHHGGGVQGVAGASEVVPLDAVELPDVVTDRVVDPVQVGETAGIKPPT